jgi:hypothetical protein
VGNSFSSAFAFFFSPLEDKGKDERAGKEIFESDSD